MIRDLNDPAHDRPGKDNGEPDARADVVVIGAGIAGLILADALVKKGLRVLVLESGGREQTEEVHPLNHVVLRGAGYKGASHGRFRCLGGTSTRWGGALLPFMDEDLAPRPNLVPDRGQNPGIGLPAWPVSMDVLKPYTGAIETLFGLCGGGYGADFLKTGNAVLSTNDPDIPPRFAKWPVFRRRNVAALLGETLENNDALTVWLNATASTFHVNRETGRLDAVTARTTGGRSLKVQAHDFAICSGAIESTRLLLLMDHQHENRIFAGTSALGRYFHDHISAPLARIQVRDRTGLNRLAGFRFVGNTMRNLRFEYAPAAQHQDGALAGFAHIACVAQGPSGFDAVRDLLRGIQQDGRLRLSLLPRIAADLPYLINAAYWRYGNKQLYWPRNAVHDLHMVAEQAPRAENRMTLTNEHDRLGQPVAALDWRITSEDCATFAAFMGRFDSYWKRNGLDRLGTLEWVATPDSLDLDHISPDGSGGIYHPGGSTRMGTDPSDSVLDGNLACHGLSNVFVAATSAFPTGASANPTMTLMMFTLRLADHLARRHS